MSSRAITLPVRQLAGVSLVLSLAGASTASAQVGVVTAPVVGHPGSAPNVPATEQRDPYALVRGWIGVSPDKHAKAVCEQHIAVVQMGLPDPEGGAGSGFGRTELMKGLYLGARSAKDPSVALAHVLVLLGMLEGESYVDALDRVIALEAQQVPRTYDCTMPYATQALPFELTDRLPDDPEREKDRLRYLTVCGDERPEPEVADEASWLMEQVLSNIEEAYGVGLVDNDPRLTASSDTDAAPRYVAVYRDADGNVRRRPMTSGYIDSVERAYTEKEARAAAVGAVNDAADIWNHAMGFLSKRYPVLGMANAPSASVFGTISAGLENLSGAFSYAGRSAAGLATVARTASLVGLAMSALESSDTATARQEQAASLNQLRPGAGDGGRAEPIDVRRSEEVLTKTLGTSVKIEPANQTKAEPEPEPIMCPVGPGPSPFDAARAVECDAMPGSEPVVPQSCQRAMREAAKQIHDGYEWSHEPADQPLPELGGSNRPAPCDDTGRNPSRCLPPEPNQVPISGALDGKHYTQESEEARGRLGHALDNAGKNIPLPTIPDLPKGASLPRVGGGSGASPIRPLR